MTKKLMIFGVLTLTLMFVIFGCAPDELEGSIKPNQAPVMGITNIDFYDSVFTFNAVINWYGTDLDGQVNYHYYKVIPSTEVGDSLQAYDYIDTALADIDLSEWTQTEETSVTINMIASPSETDTLYQYLFFMCEDDEGSLSIIRFYALYRINRLPQTYIDELPGYTEDPSPTWIPDWSIPDTNALWDGLKIAWSGDDTLDFPDGAPDFEYKWELYGPYSKDHYSIADSLISDLSLDSATADKMFYRSCADSETGYKYTAEGDTTCDSYWVWDQEINLANLSTGCYIFKVVARDDALVPDQTPAWGTFIVVEPSWIAESDTLLKDILIIQSTQYQSRNLYPGYLRDSITVDTSTFYFPDSIMGFYRSMIEGTGQSYTYDIYGEPSYSRFGNSKTDFPDLYTIARYRMIIIDDVDFHKTEYAHDASTNPFVAILEGYLNVGGKVWLIGRESMTTIAGAAGYENFAANSMAVDYFDLSAAIYAENDVTNTGEFVGATTLFDDLFDNLVYNPVRVGYLDLSTGINKVEVLIRNSDKSRTLFTYDAIVPDTLVDFQYMPCAVQYTPEHQVFKTSYFSFPLYLMSNSNGEVQQTFDTMLNWFLNEEN